MTTLEEQAIRDRGKVETLEAALADARHKLWIANSYASAERQSAEGLQTSLKDALACAERWRLAHDEIRNEHNKRCKEARVCEERLVQANAALESWETECNELRRRLSDKPRSEDNHSARQCSVCHGPLWTVGMDSPGFIRERPADFAAALEQLHANPTRTRCFTCEPEDQ